MDKDLVSRIQRAKNGDVLAVTAIEYDMYIKDKSVNEFYTKEVLDAFSEKGAPKGDETFKKADTSKNRVELIDPDFILGVGEVLTFGANKYAPNNWKKATDEDIDRIKGALFRHFLTYLSGDKYDKETELNHLYHIGCNAMFLAHFDKKEQ